MTLDLNQFTKTIFLLFLGLLLYSTNAFAVKSAPSEISNEVQLDEKSLIAKLEQAKGKKLSLIDKLAAKLLIKKAKKKKRGAAGQKKGMAITAFISGILSVLLILLPAALPTLAFAGGLFVLLIIAAILAIVFGAIAKRNADSYPDVYGGRNLALAGFIAGLVSLSLIVLGILFVLAAFAGIF